MDYQRVRNAAARDGRTYPARSSEGKTIRTHAGNSEIDWAIAARRDGSGSDGRSHGLGGLRRDSGGRRNADGVDYGGFCGAGAGVRTAGGRGNSEEIAAD